MRENDLARSPSPVQRRLIASAEIIEVEDPTSILYQHAVLCQVAMPYRNPGDDVQIWDREHGAVSLSIRGGRVKDPGTGKWRHAGIPYGCKPRMILAFLNAQALRTGSPIVELETSLRAFLGRLELNPGGRTMRTVKDQLTRLAAAQVSMAVAYKKDRCRQVQTTIVGGLDLWLERDGDRHIVWPTTVRLSADYFTSLQEHAVPLDERAIIALSNNARALDIYAWLAQRLWRLRRPTLVSWASLQAQFGAEHADPYRFRQLFRWTLGLVLSQYPKARIELGDRGLMVFESPTPVRIRRA